MSTGVIYSPRPEVDVPLISLSRLMIDKMKYFGDKTYLVFHIKHKYNKNINILSSKD